MKRRLLLALLSILVLCVSAIGGIFTTATASAAQITNSGGGSTVSSSSIPSDTELQRQGEASTACKNAGFGGDDQHICGSYYVQGYKHPNASYKDACEDAGITISLCHEGYPAGQKDRKIADNQASQPSQSGDLTTAQIKALAATSPTCAQYDGQVGALSASCIAGYIGGYKNQDKDSVCDSHKVTLPDTCKKGYDAGKSDKAAGVKNQAQQISASGQASGESDTDTKELDCDAKFDNPLSWFICPVVDGLVSFIGAIDNMITDQLSIETSPIFGNSEGNCEGSDSCNAYYSAWKSFRTIALGLMVIAGLVIVISQALGMEILDAYTIRKALPRVLIAAIAITLSWPLMQFFVNFSNDLGFGIRHLIYAPFTGLSNEFDLTFGGSITSTFLGLGGLALLGIMGLLSYAVTAALAVFIAIIVLILRQVAIILMVILAPVAIVAYILPNTQRIYKLWWESFSKALMMFPLIAAFIASGRVFAAVAINKPGTLNQLIGFAAYFAPYFLIPLTFKFAGGALRGIGGFVNDRGRGGFDRLRNYRSNKAKTNLEAMRAGNRIKASNPFSNTFNAATRGIANAGSAGTVPWKWRSRFQAGMSEASMVDVAEQMEKNTAFRAISGNDDYMQATMKSMGGGDTEDDWRRYLSGQDGYDGRSIEQGVAAIRAAKRSMNDDTFKKAAVLANAKTRTGWKKGGAGSAFEAINDAWGDDRDGAIRALAQVRSDTKQAGRQDIGGASFGKSLEVLQALHNSRNLPDKIDGKDNPKKYKAEAATRDIIQNAWDVNSAGSWVGMSGHALKLMAPVIGDDVRQVLATGKPEAIDAKLAQVANLVDVANYATPEGADIFAQEIFSQPTAFPKFETHAEDVTRQRPDGSVELLHRKGEFKLDASGDRIPRRDNENKIITQNVKEAIQEREASSEKHPQFHNVRKAMRMTEEEQQNASRGQFQPPAGIGPQ